MVLFWIMEFLQWAIAPWIALCNSSIDDVSLLYIPPTLLVPVLVPVLAPMNPVRLSTPEWLGEDLIEDGQLETQLFLRGYLKFPEKDWEINPLTLSFLVLILSLCSFVANKDTVLAVVELVVTSPPPPIFCCCCCCCCFWESFSYKGFTFFKYFRITSLAVELILFTDEPDTVSGSRVFGSFLNTDENLDSEKYLGFLIWVLGLWRRLNSSSSVTELGLDESHSASNKRSLLKEEWESLELPVESREAVVVVSEEEEVLEEAKRRVRTMERRGEVWRGKSWPL